MKEKILKTRNKFLLGNILEISDLKAKKGFLYNTGIK